MKNINDQILISMAMFKPKNYYGLDLSGTTLHTKMIFMNRVIMVGFSAGAQVFQAEDGSRPTIQKNTLFILKDPPANILISMISLQ